MLSDLRYAFRQLLKSPGFTVVALLSLGLGIGGTTAIFSVLNTLLLKPLPYPEADRLVQVAERVPAGFYATADGGVYMDWEDQTTQLESIAAIHSVSKNLTGGGDPVRVNGAEVTARYLHVLGIQPMLGRDFAAAEDAPGGNRHVLILSYDFWQSHFLGDASVVGRVLQADGENYTVIGVLPARALLQPDLNFLTPATIRADAYKQITNYNYVCNVIGRLKPGVTLEQAVAELDAARPGVLAKYPSFRHTWTMGMRSLQEATFGSARPFAFTLLWSVAAVLLIVCANIGNLLLARGAARQNEMAVRAALGASKGRLVRQVLTESMLLALAGGALGLLLGAWAIHPLVTFIQLDSAAPGLDVTIDWRVMAFTLLATAFTGILFGLFPALSASRTAVNGALKEANRGSTSGHRRRLQSALIVTETALTVLLLTCAGLLLRSFFRASASDVGFAREQVLTFSFSLPASKAPTIDHRLRFDREVQRCLRELPGVAYVGVASSTPMNGRVNYGEFVSREERPETRNDLNAGFDGADGDLFAALGVPLLRGRIFTEADNLENAPRVMIINEALARQLFPDEEPVGRLLNFKNATWEIVGVVGSVRQYRSDLPPQPHLFIPRRHFPWSAFVVVKTRLAPLALADEVRRAVLAVDPEQPIANLSTLDQAVDATLQNRRVLLSLVMLFAITALLLALIGIYGVMAYSVAQRTRELGIRIALGADLSQVIRLVLGDGVKLVLLGVAVGAVASLAAARLIASQLYATSSADPVILLGVAALLLLTALGACWLPARRATKVDPIIALRTE